MLSESGRIDAPFSEQPVITRNRDTNANLRTQLLRIIAKAELTPWPKLFQNLRASRATELAAMHPGHVAAAWMGHSTKVADKHYWRVNRWRTSTVSCALQMRCSSQRQHGDSDGNGRKAEP